MDANTTKWWHWLRGACVKDDLMPAQVRRPPEPFCSRHHGYPEDSICCGTVIRANRFSTFNCRPIIIHEFVCAKLRDWIPVSSFLPALAVWFNVKRSGGSGGDSAVLSSSLLLHSVELISAPKRPGSSPPHLPRTMSALTCETRRGHKLAIRPLKGDMLLGFNLVILLRGACKTVLHLNIFIDLGEIYSIWLYGTAIVVGLWQWKEQLLPPAASASINSRKTIHASSSIAWGRNLSCYDHNANPLIGSSRPTTTCFTSCNTIKGVAANDEQGLLAL